MERKQRRENKGDDLTSTHNLRGWSQKFRYTHCFATVTESQSLQHLWSSSTIS